MTDEKYRFAGAQKATGVLVLGSGVLAPSFDIEAWHRLSLALNGSTVSAWLDDQQMANIINDGAFDHGLAGIGSGWNTAYFHNLSIQPIGQQPPSGAALALINTNTGITQLSSANSSSGWFGTKLRLTAAVTLSSLARFRAANSTGRHNVSLFALSNVDTLGNAVASVCVDCSNIQHASKPSLLDRFGFVWSTLSEPVRLKAGAYVLASQEHHMGDPFYFDASDGPCAGNSDGHDGGSAWISAVGDAVQVLGAARSVDINSTGSRWAISTAGDQSQHAFGPVNLAVTAVGAEGSRPPGK
eukprot:COSAG01_NODE_8218_length_2870_cov_4.446770_2_plen_299_part_00